MENPPFPNDFPLRDSQRGPPTIATRTLAQRPIVVGTVDASIKEPLGTGCFRWALPRSGTDHLLRSWCPVKGRDTKNRIPFAFFQSNMSMEIPDFMVDLVVLNHRTIVGGFPIKPCLFDIPHCQANPDWNHLEIGGCPGWMKNVQSWVVGKYGKIKQQECHNWGVNQKKLCWEKSWFCSFYVHSWPKLRN